MAKLKCAHERRVMVIRSAKNDPVTRHRNDGSPCDSRYVAIDKVVYEPAAHKSVGTTQDVVFGPLGPMITVGTLAEAATRGAKKPRQVKKIKR